MVEGAPGPGTELRGLPSPERRTFLGRLMIAIGAAGAAILAVPVIGVLVAPLRRERAIRWIRVGAVADFPRGETVKVRYEDPDALPWAGPAGVKAVWIRRDEEDRFTALSTYCTHVGCPVRWVAGARLFLCPCHGGAFRQDGSVAAGPPPRPLDRFEIRVRGEEVEILPGRVPVPG